MPIYLSAPAHTFVSLTSYPNFRFLLHLRLQAWFGEHGCIRDGLAESFYWYSQNLPTVALLLPRAALSLALLFAFSAPAPGPRNRDATFFTPNQGSLNAYARGILIANTLWTAWRILLLLLSWFGLWIISAQGCAGLCGPRYRWEEEDNDKTRSSVYSDDIDALPWAWKECTRLRIQDTFQLCSTKPRWGRTSLSSWSKEKGNHPVLASIGIPRSPAPARHHRTFADDVFESSSDGHDNNGDDGEEIQLRRRLSDRGIGSSTYPFRQQGSAHVSSQDTVPFPPSLTKSKSKHTTVTTSSESTSTSTSGSTENDSSDRPEEQEESEEHSTGRGSNSMSSLGYPISPSRRYPFGLRHPARRGNSTSSRSHQSRSGVSQSTGNQLSTEPPSSSSSSDHPSASPTDEDRPRASPSQSSNSSIPMPPRHPNPQIRTRAPSVVPIPVSLPTLRANSGSLPGVGAELVQDDAESVSSSSNSDFVVNDDEQQDEVGLLSPGASNTHLAVPGSEGGGGESGSASLSSRSRSRTGSSSTRSRSSVPVVRTRTRTRSRVSSLGAAVRSQAQTLLKRVSSATSLGVVVGGGGGSGSGGMGMPRSRMNSSMVRLEEEVGSSHHDVPEVLSSGRSMRDDSVVAAAAATSLTTTTMTTERESSHSDVFPFLISEPRAWEEEEEEGAVEVNHEHDHPEMTVSTHSSGDENWTFGRPMMFMRRSSSLPVAIAVATTSTSCVDGGGGSGVPLDQGQKHDDDGGDGGNGNGNTGYGVGIDIPWDRSRLYERYGMPSASASASVSERRLMVRPDISTAAPSFVTVPLMMEEGTTTESGVGSRGSDSSGGGGGGGIGLGGIGPERRDRMGDWRQR